MPTAPRWLLVAALLVASGCATTPSSRPQDAGFCQDLNRTTDAVRQGRLAALTTGRAPSPSFGFSSGCGVQGAGWFCYQALAPDALSVGGLAAQVSGCLPAARRLSTPDPMVAVFVSYGVRLEIVERGARGAHVGRIVSFSIEQGPR